MDRVTRRRQKQILKGKLEGLCVRNLEDICTCAFVRGCLRDKIGLMTDEDLYQSSRMSKFMNGRSLLLITVPDSRPGDKSKYYEYYTGSLLQDLHWASRVQKLDGKITGT